MNPPERRIDADWYRRTFDELYPLIYAHRTVESAGPEARFARETLGLGKDETVLDLACGNGRHLAYLAPRARCAVGLDYSRELLLRARSIVGPEALLVRADMRAVPFVSVFDCVTNFFTSFGYFPTEEENLQTVRSVAGALKPGGRFFIDYLNRGRVEQTLVPRSHRKAGDYEIAEERWIDPSLRRVNKTTTLYRGGEVVQVLGESVRMYEAEELIGLLEQGGLRVERLFGNFDGSDYAPGKPRMIAVGRRI